MFFYIIFAQFKRDKTMEQKVYQRINTITGWIVFLVAAIVYILTMEPTTSFWDCGEFITTAYKLEVGHPPGAPFFMVLGRFFTLFAFGDETQVPVMINLLSALASAFTIMFLFWTITHIARKIVAKKNEYDTAKIISIIGAGLIGALTYTFTDTFWFSAVEGEVYALSSFFTAVVFWAILKWENVADTKYANRWLILIAYLMGLSIGVHLLNLLAIPAITFVYYYRKYKPTKKGFFFASLIAVLLLGSIMYGIIQGVVMLSAWFERIFVNSFGLPYNSGAIFYLVLILGAIIYGLYYTYHHKKVVANTIILGITVILIGYSSFAIILIRSIADPPMNQNKPNTVFSLLSYLNREQYGDRPLVYGEYFNAPVIDYDEGDAIYVKRNGKYEIIDRKIKRVFNENYTTIFPRMYSDQSSPNHVKGYKDWTGFSGDKPPMFKENLEFFFKYQINHMYIRYFMWNFAGRQNDIQNVDGNVRDGNWISGIPFIDNARLGDQDLLPDYLKNNKARNTFYFLPLILGLIGAYFLYKKNKKDCWVVFLLFFFTGIAIVIYLNQPPFQPRERDYAYAGSFYAFAIYIGFGVLSIIEFLKKYLSPTPAAVLSTIVSLIVPGLLAAENWDDHDRSGRYVARDFASNYLNSCEENAVLFTNGDNDTFPLWYAQEVEGIRTDVRVINLSYLNTDWYINQMRKKAYKSDPVPFSMSPEKYQQGKRDIVYIHDRIKRHVNLKELVQFVANDDKKTKIPYGDDFINFFPARKYSVPVDSAKVVENGTVPERSAGEILPEIKNSFQEGKNYVRKNELMVLDLLSNNDWERPIYFAVTVGPGGYLNFQDYFQLDGLAYRVVPIKTPGSGGNIGRIETSILYDNMMNTFKWGGINKPGVYIDENIGRMLMNIKNNFSRLAKSLVEEGKKDSALQVLNRCIELMPHDKVPFNFYDLLIAEGYYLAGDTEKGNEMMRIVGDVTSQEVRYLMSLSTEETEPLTQDMQRSFAIMGEIIRMTKHYGQEELSKEFENNMNQLIMNNPDKFGR